MRPDILDAMRYAYDRYMKEKEKKTMNEIKWKVDEIRIDRGICSDDSLTVEINGMFDNRVPFKKPVTFDSLAKELEHKLNGSCYPIIKDVIFNDPATIVFWTDGTKTVVKCQEGDEFDPEKGLTMAIVKKVYGNKGSYCNVIKKWCEPYYERRSNIQPWLDAIKDAVNQLSKVCDA